MNKIEDWRAEQLEIAERATKGPWTSEPGGVIRGGPFHEYVRGKSQSQIALACGNVNMNPEEQEKNRDFIAHARTTVPRALRMLEVYRNVMAVSMKYLESCGYTDPTEPEYQMLESIKKALAYTGDEE